MVSFVILIGTLRVNVLFVLLFFGLVMLFSFIAAADAAIPSAATEADLAHILKLLQIGGGGAEVVDGSWTWSRVRRHDGRGSERAMRWPPVSDPG